LPWLESFAVGHHALDEEHQDLLEACNELCALIHEGGDGQIVRKAAAGLIAAVERHFASEEAIFPQIGYDQRLSHMREHLTVVDSLNKLLLKGCGLEPAVAASTGRLILLEHILRHDLRFKTWVLHAAGR